MKTVAEKAAIVRNAIGTISLDMDTGRASNLMKSVNDCPLESLAKLFDIVNACAQAPVPMTADDTFNSTTGN